MYSVKCPVMGGPGKEQKRGREFRERKGGGGVWTHTCTYIHSLYVLASGLEHMSGDCHAVGALPNMVLLHVHTCR